jgi:hypothetical protein
VDLNFYRFRSSWDVDAPKADVYSALDAFDHYPDWWPEVRSAEKLAEGTYRVRVRSWLPYDLEFVGTERERDQQRGILSMHMDGDLEGFSRWTLTANGLATTVTFDEEVTVNKAMLRRLAIIGRPAYRWNHGLMIRHCKTGLRACLAGIHLARANE